MAGPHKQIGPRNHEIPSVTDSNRIQRIFPKAFSFSPMISVVCHVRDRSPGPLKSIQEVGIEDVQLLSGDGFVHVSFPKAHARSRRTPHVVSPARVSSIVANLQEMRRSNFSSVYKCYPGLSMMISQCSAESITSGKLSGIFPWTRRFKARIPRFQANNKLLGALDAD